MQFQAIAAQLEFLAWRDTQFSAISGQLEDALPALQKELVAQIESASVLNLMRVSHALKSSAKESIQRWGTAQMEIALRRAEAELDQVLHQLPEGVRLDTGTWEQVTKALPAIAGVGLIAASVLAIPTVVTFATVPASWLAFGAAASISWPLFAVGAAGIGVATLAGSQSLKFAQEKARAKLSVRLHREAEQQIFGIGGKSGARSMLSDIQAAVVQAGQNKIEALA